MQIQALKDFSAVKAFTICIDLFAVCRSISNGCKAGTLKQQWQRDRCRRISIPIEKDSIQAKKTAVTTMKQTAERLVTVYKGEKLLSLHRDAEQVARVAKRPLHWHTTGSLPLRKSGQNSQTLVSHIHGSRKKPA